MNISNNILKLAVGIVAVGAITTAVWFSPFASTYKEVSNGNKELLLKELLNEWQITLPGSYKVTNYRERAVRGESATSLMYFRLELTTKKEAQLILSDPILDEIFKWSRTSEFLEIRPKIDWWLAESNAVCYYGSLPSADTVEYIRFNILVADERASVLVEAHGRKGAKKKWIHASTTRTNPSGSSLQRY